LLNNRLFDFLLKISSIKTKAKFSIVSFI
jgi:hypothetical protein